MDQAQAVQTYPEAEASWQIAIGLYGKAVEMAMDRGYPLHTLEIDCMGWFFSGDMGRPRWGYKPLASKFEAGRARFCFRFSPEEAATYGIDGYIVYDDGHTGPYEATEAFRKEQEKLQADKELRQARGSFVTVLRQRMAALVTEVMEEAVAPLTKLKRTKGRKKKR